MNRIVWTLAVAAATTSCGERELGDDVAAARIRAHMTSLAPTVFQAESLTSAVAEVRPTDEHSRDVRFHVFQEPQPRNRSSTLTARFTRGEQGWVLARYGMDMARYVASLVAAERGLAFADLEAFVEAAGRLIRQSGPDEPAIEELVEDSLGGTVDGLEWGVAGGGIGEEQRVLWARSLYDDSVACAARVPSPEGPWRVPLEFMWVDRSDSYLPTCRSDRIRRYKSSNAAREALQEIVGAGGLLQPQPAR